MAAELRDRLPEVGAKKLHKLLYYCQGHHLVATGAPLFVESVSAWDQGPVVGRLWRSELDGEQPAARQPMDEAQLNTVGYVVSRYGRLSGRDLEHLTHSEDPRRRADAMRSAGQSVRIEERWLRKYFESSVGEDDEDDLVDQEVVRAWLTGARDRLSDELAVDSVGDLRSRLHDAG
ncbi:MAG: Panacea domain-containing protein [Marmoricola sp.]